MRPGEEIRVEGGRFERLVVVRELGRPAEAGPTFPPSFVAHAHAPEGAELVVVERYRNLSPPSRDALQADVKRTSSLKFPNLGQVLEASRHASDVFVSTAFVEGELLGSLRTLATAAGKPLSVDVGVRVVVDVLAALSTLHTDKTGADKVPPLPALVHGAVAPHTIAVGFDGVTRLLRPYVGRLLALNLDGALAGYAAPEQLRTGKGSPRADVFAVGVILWETLAQARLFEKTTREGRLAKATMPIPKLTLEGDHAWTAPLVPIVEKALSSDPLARYGTAAEMAAAVRLAVRAKLAMPARVAEIVDRHAGERILARRGELALPTPSAGERRSVRPSVPDGAARVLENIRPSSRPPTPTPAAVAPIVVPKAPPVPAMAAPKPKPPNPGPRPVIAPVELTPPPASVEELDMIEVESVRSPPVAAPAVPPPVLPANLADDVLAGAAPIAVAPAEPPPVAVAPAPVVAPTPVAAPAAAPIPTPAPTSAPALPTPGAIAVPADDVPAGLPPQGRRKWLPLLLLLLPILGIALFFALRNPGGTVQGQPSATARPTTPTSTTTIAATSTATATGEPTATGNPSATATTTASDTASAGTTEPSATAPPTGSGAWPRPSGSGRVRPKPTYDPEGI